MDDKLLEEYKQLVTSLNYYSYEYYNNNRSIISDAEYDSLYKRLKDIEEQNPEIIFPNSPTRKVGSKPSSKLAKVVHDIPMLSLDNAFSFDDVGKFYDRIAKLLAIDFDDIKIFAEPKIDGLSASVVYKNGAMQQASTRGNGIEGEDVTKNARFIKTIPQTIEYTGDLEVRGEVYFLIKDFEELNEKQKEQGGTVFSSPRNAASGSLRLLDNRLASKRPLNFFAYQAIGPDFTTQEEISNFLKKQGFNVNPFSKLCNSIDDVRNFYEELSSKRQGLEYEIDGVVYKYNDLEGQEILGKASKYPRHSIAHKFDATQVVTKILEIQLSVGRSGIVTPVAILDPIKIGGALISKATLHNKMEIERKDIRVGDSVTLQRAGDVIPQVVNSLKELRTPESQPFVFPDKCPSCASTLVIDGPFMRCEAGKACPDQFIENLGHMFSKDAFNIEGLGKSNIVFLVKNEFVKSDIDIFNLRQINEGRTKKIRNFEGWGRLSESNLLNEIDLRKNVALDKFIYSLAIPQVGKNTSVLLANYFKSVDNLLNFHNQRFQISSLTSINGIGQLMAEEICAFLNDPENQKHIADLMAVTNVSDLTTNNDKKGSILQGKSFVFTGVFNQLKRDEAAQLVKDLGGHVSESISRKTSYLVAGSNPGSKLQKAQSFGVPILNQSDFENLTKQAQ